MRSVRAFRRGTVAAVIVWKLAALALLPAALCCRAVMVADGTGAPACCEGDEHGAMCPMKRGGRTEETDAAQAQPRMVGCNSLDDALIGMLSLTGFTPEVFGFASDTSSSEPVAELGYTTVSLVDPPSPPPPRA